MLKKIIFISMFLFSCKNDKEKFNDNLSCAWSIEEMFYEDKNVLDSLNYNSISFNFPNEGQVFIPKSFGYEGGRFVFTLSEKNKNFIININTTNKIFNDVFKAEILKDGKGWKQLTLTSDELKIKAYTRDLLVGFD